MRTRGSASLASSAGVLGRDEQLAERADHPEVLALGATDAERIEPILGRQRVAGRGRLQADAADRPIAFARRQQIVEGDRLMGAVECADAEMDDACRQRVEVVSAGARRPTAKPASALRPSCSFAFLVS